MFFLINIIVIVVTNQINFVFQLLFMYQTLIFVFTTCHLQEPFAALLLILGLTLHDFVVVPHE